MQISHDVSYLITQSGVGPVSRYVREDWPEVFRMLSTAGVPVPETQPTDLPYRVKRMDYLITVEEMENV